MLDIPRDFFREEIRDGYVVSEMMKRSWATQIDILESIKKLCVKYGLKYYADYGTLLGAVRHKGYIPWDDDLDISMPRKDFMIFMEHADELDEGLVFRSIYNSETYMNVSAVVTQKAEILKWDDRRTQRYYGCPFICYVDIFPWDYVPRDEAARVKQTQMFLFSYKLMYEVKHMEQVLFGGKMISLDELRQSEYMKYTIVHEIVDRSRELLRRFEVNYGIKMEIDPNSDLRHQICIMTDKIAQLCDSRDADGIDYFSYYWSGRTNPPRKHKEWTGAGVELPFEFTTIRAPEEYIKVLESKFGKDFMKPVQFYASHDYPFFRNEIRVLIGGDTGEMLADAPLRTPTVEMIPEEIRGWLLKDDGNLKTIIIYGLSATDIINGGSDGLKRIIEYLEEQEKDRDRAIFVFVPSGLKNFMDRCNLSMYQDFCVMLEKVSAMNNVIFDDKPTTDMLWALISICDEYYGDECRLAEICRNYDVPVTIREK